MIFVHDHQLKFGIFFIIFNIKVNVVTSFNIYRFHCVCFMGSCCCIYLLYPLIYQYAYFLTLQSYVSRFYSSKFWWVFQLQQIFIHYGLIIFQFCDHAITIWLTYYKSHYLYLPIFSLVCVLTPLTFFKMHSKWKWKCFFILQGNNQSIFSIKINNA